MKENWPVSNKHYLREIDGTIIFDKNGGSVGVAVHDGSLDYASQSEKENTVVIIRPSGKGNKS